MRTPRVYAHIPRGAQLTAQERELLEDAVSAFMGILDEACRHYDTDAGADGECFTASGWFVVALAAFGVRSCLHNYYFRSRFWPRRPRQPKGFPFYTKAVARECTSQSVDGVQEHCVVRLRNLRVDWTARQFVESARSQRSGSSGMRSMRRGRDDLQGTLQRRQAGGGDQAQAR